MSTTYGDFEIKEAIINATGAGEKTIIAAAAGKTYRILAIFFYLAAAEAITIKSGSTALTGAMTISSFERDFTTAQPWFICADNEAFIISLATGGQTSGRVYYLEG